MSKNVPAVILSHGPGGLGAVRTLARRGVEVFVYAIQAKDLVLRSRYPKQTTLVGGYCDKEKEAGLLRLLRKFDREGAVLLATSDRLITFISDNRDELRLKFRFTLPPTSLLNALNDKKQETHLIDSLGFPIPKSVQSIPNTPSDLMRELRFPIIFKPASFAVRNLFPHKNAIIHDEVELNQFYEKWKSALSALIAQEVIPGPDEYSWICSCTFNQRHEMLDYAIKQKLRMYPIHFGVSSLAVSKENAELIRIVDDLGKKLKCVGHTHLEFRWDVRDGLYKYIEINPRIPGNVEFDEDSGVPTAWNSYKVAIDENFNEKSNKLIENIYFLDWEQDLYSQLKDNVPKLKILKTLFSHFTKCKKGPYFAYDDPIPGIVSGFRFLNTVLNSIFKKTKRALFSEKSQSTTSKIE